jgi:hypothetical protein
MSAVVFASAGTDGDDRLLSAAESWFVRRGLPYFIEDRKATDDVFTRALPLLAFYFVVSLMVVLSLHLTVPQRVAGAALGIALLLAIYLLRNLVAGRGVLALPQRIGWIELGAFVIVPPAVDAVVRRDWRLNGLQSWRITGIDLAVNLGVVLGIYLFTSALPLVRWTVKRTFQELGEVFDLAARALPLLFLFNSFLFISKDVWEFAGEMTRHRLWAVVGLFVVFTVLFLVYRLPAEVRRVAEHDDHEAVSRACQGTPMAGVADRVDLHEGELPLSRKQRGNVLMVLFVGQMLQVVLLALLVFVFFAGFGWVTMDGDHIREWTGLRPENAVAFGHPLSYYVGFDLDRKLFQVAIFLAGVSGFFFAVSSMTDDAYREQFYERMNGELETAIQVRRVYLALYEGRHAADGDDPSATHPRLRLPHQLTHPHALAGRPVRRWFEQTPYSDAPSSGQGQEAVEHPAAEVEG